jgi:Winged helix DNA-binding domain
MLNIAHSRLLNQRIIDTNLQSPKAVVAHLGAMQAQDYPMAKWAVGLRLPSANDALIEKALNNGEIVRTHVLRPTWHFVAAEDVRWLLKLTAPHIHSSMNSYNKQMELDAPIFNKSNLIIEKALTNNTHLTREELMIELGNAGIVAQSNRAAHLMMNAELEGIVCNGIMRGKQQTYALMDEKVPKGLIFTREEAIVELAKRYFHSHAPATLQDFQWWSGLPMQDVRKGIEAIKNDFISEKINNQIYYFNLNNKAFKTTESIHFLPSFDEFTVSYKDRSDSIEPHLKEIAMTNNGIFKPIIVVNGRVIGIWKRTIKKDKLIIEVQFFNNYPPLEKDIMLKEIKRFGDFNCLEIEFT